MTVAGTAAGFVPFGPRKIWEASIGEPSIVPVTDIVVAHGAEMAMLSMPP